MSAASPTRGWWAGRAGLVFPLLLAAFATYLLVGQLVMPVDEDVDLPGPRFFPAIVITALYAFAVLLTISLIRSPQHPVSEVRIGDDGRVQPNADRGKRWFSDWPRLAWAVGGFVAFILLLQPGGWILSGALLFWCTAKALDSKHPIRDIAVSLTFSSLLYLVFAGLLSVNLPAGLLFGGRI